MTRTTRMTRAWLARVRRAPTIEIVVLSHRLRLSLLVAQAVGVMTLLRSIAYDRWITVLASLFLIGGAYAATRGRTWGVGMAFASAVAFPVAFAIGIAPAWFCLVGLAGAWPLAIAWRSFARFDKGAATLLATIAATAGAAAAIAWKEVAWSVISTFPSLRPSIEAQHGIALLATMAVVVGVVAGRAKHPADASASSEGEARVRFGERVRIGNPGSPASESAHHDELAGDRERLHGDLLSDPETADAHAPRARRIGS
jgi:hypothetical protein